jgi:hypothetical protein
MAFSASTHCPRGEAMSRWWSLWLIEHRFPLRVGNCDRVVQVYEKRLRCEEPMDAFRTITVHLVDEHPKHSQDLSAIDNAWKIVRDRLDETMPTWLETRDDFIVRLRNAVKWVSANRHMDLWHLSTSQEERAKDVQSLQGSREKW